VSGRELYYAACRCNCIVVINRTHLVLIENSQDTVSRQLQITCLDLLPSEMASLASRKVSVGSAINIQRPCVANPRPVGARRSRAATAAPAAGRADAPITPDSHTRRQTLAVAAAAAAALALNSAAPPALAAEEGAAAAACTDLTDTPSGLKFCEIEEGTGKEPTQGGLIRWVGGGQGHLHAFTPGRTACACRRGQVV
jgi:hypothetical protein